MRERKALLWIKVEVEHRFLTSQESQKNHIYLLNCKATLTLKTPWVNTQLWAIIYRKNNFIIPNLSLFYAFVHFFVSGSLAIIPLSEKEASWSFGTNWVSETFSLDWRILLKLVFCVWDFFLVYAFIVFICRFIESYLAGFFWEESEVRELGSFILFGGIFWVFDEVGLVDLAWIENPLMDIERIEQYCELWVRIYSIIYAFHQTIFSIYIAFSMTWVFLIFFP